jgi:hypothetical protein
VDHKCRYCGKNHLEGTPLPIEDWPWRAIIYEERKHVARIRKGPKCSVCDKPMFSGLGDRHFVCRDILDR